MTMSFLSYNPYGLAVGTGLAWFFTVNQLTQSKTIDVVLVDDQTLFAESLAYAMEHIADELTVCARFSDGLAFVQALGSFAADVVLIDNSMPRMDGIAATKRFHDLHPETAVVLMADSAQKSVVERAFSAGARGVVFKQTGIETVIGAIHTVARGKRYLDSSLSNELRTNLRRADRQGGTCCIESELTQRQSEILGLVCDGMDEVEIAEALGISKNTVHVHKNNIMRSLGVHSKLGLLKYAIRNNLVTVE